MTWCFTDEVQLIFYGLISVSCWIYPNRKDFAAQLWSFFTTTSFVWGWRSVFQGAGLGCSAVGCLLVLHSLHCAGLSQSLAMWLGDTQHLKHMFAFQVQPIFFYGVPHFLKRWEKVEKTFYLGHYFHVLLWYYPLHHPLICLSFLQVLMFSHLTSLCPLSTQGSHCYIGEAWVVVCKES